MARWPQYTDDPVADHASYCRAQEQEMEHLPVCDECGERIDTDFLYEFDGYCICEDCLDANHRKWTVDCCE